MDGWPTDAAVEAATRAVLAEHHAVDYDEEGDTPWRQEREARARTALEAAGLPEVMGVRAVADLLGVQSSNLDRTAGLPAPLFERTEFLTGRLWSADAVRRFDAARKATA